MPTKTAKTTCATGLKCDDCGTEYPLSERVNTCPSCGGLLDVTYDLPAMSRDDLITSLAGRSLTVWRWREFLPIQDPANIVSLGEGYSPLLKCEQIGGSLGLPDLFVKNDSVSPTGSLKDRSFAIAVSKAKELGVSQAFTYSSGNAGISLAAYASRARMKAVVAVNAWASAQKILMMQALGAEVIKLDWDSFEQVDKALASLRGKLRLYEFVNFVNPFRHEGQKTYAYEICEQLGWQVPDYMIHPIGTGGGIFATWKGFNELKRVGVIKKTPRMIGVQPAACAPLVDAFLRGSREAVPTGDAKATIAQSIASDMPFDRGRRPLRAVYESDGAMVAVTDEQIVASILMLGQEGIYSEPAGAATIAGAQMLVRQGVIEPGATVVCVVTGSGLKQPDVLQGMLKEPVAFKADSVELVEHVKGLFGDKKAFSH